MSLATALPADYPETPPRPRIRRLRVIATEPPFRDDTPTPLALLTALSPLPLPAVEPDFGTPLLAPVPSEKSEDGTRRRVIDADLRRLFGIQRTGSAKLPDPRPRAAAAVRVLMEVLAGDRPARQVSGWVSASVLAGLESRVGSRPGKNRPRQCLLRSLHLSEPSDGAAEIAAVVDTGTRCRAVALRMEGRDGRWVITALHAG